MIHMMSRKVFSILLYLTCLALYRAETENCVDYGTDFQRVYVLEGEAVYMECPLSPSWNKNLFDFNISWCKNGSQTQITSDTMSRVHQSENLLKFFPAKTEDAGFFLCLLSNATYCIKKLKKLEVFKHQDGLCYNDRTMFAVEDYITSSNTIWCPQIKPYLDVQKAKIKWFKECQPLDLSSDRYLALEDFLTIENVNFQDEGNYTCETTFMDNGTEFAISRAIAYSLREPQKLVSPTILSPENNILEVELDSFITLFCKVSYVGDPYDVFWYYNGTMLDEIYESDKRVLLGDSEIMSTQDGQTIVSRNLSFTKVKEEDYNKKFYCEVYFSFSPRAYVMLMRPTPNLQVILIPVFISVFLIIVIAIVTFKIFKFDIVLWYRSSCFAHKNKKVADGKLYDAYIMYPKRNSSYTMDIFVLKVLPEVLERQCTYRLFIFGRDELPGQAIADLIDETISQSRRLVIVLENTSMENRLGDDFEQQIAMHDALIRNKLKVILIELGKIKDYTNMPESVKYIKQKQGVVRWKADFTDAALSPNTRFWKNIRYLMPPTYIQDLDYAAVDFRWNIPFMCFQSLTI